MRAAAAGLILALLTPGLSACSVTRYVAPTDFATPQTPPRKIPLRVGLYIPPEMPLHSFSQGAVGRREMDMFEVGDAATAGVERLCDNLFFRTIRIHSLESDLSSHGIQAIVIPAIESADLDPTGGGGTPTTTFTIRLRLRILDLRRSELWSERFTGRGVTTGGPPAQTYVAAMRRGLEDVFANATEGIYEGKWWRRVDTPAYALADYRYNEVMFKQTHNSFQRSLQPWEKQLDFDPAQPWHAGCSGLEFDLLPKLVPEFKLKLGRPPTEQWRLDPHWEWFVGHVEADKIIDIGKGLKKWSKNPTKAPNVMPAFGDKDRFAAYLNRLERWSRAHPDHRVITVQIELKDPMGLGAQLRKDKLSNFGDKLLADFVPAGFSSSYREQLPDKLDAYIAKHFDTRLLYKPRDLMAGETDLVRAGRQRGWPRLSALKGKFIFVVHSQTEDIKGGAAQHYADRPELRLCFSSRAGDPRTESAGSNILFWRMGTDGDGWTDKAKWAASHPEFITRGWPESGKIGSDEDKFDDLGHWSRACAKGVNIIATNQARAYWATVGTEPFWPIPRRFWSDATSMTTRNGATGTGTPGLAFFDGRMVVAYTDESALNYFTFDPFGPSDRPAPPSAIAQEEATGRPVLVEFDGKLWVFYKGVDGEICARTFDGVQWSPRSRAIADATAGPCAIVFRDRLYLFYPNDGGYIARRYFDGTRWSEEEAYSGRTSVEPAVAAFGDELMLIYTREGGDDIFCARYDGTTWRDTRCLSTVNQARTVLAPAVVALGDAVEVIFSEPKKGDLFQFTIRNDGQISGLRGIGRAKPGSAVACAAAGEDLFAVFQSEEGSGYSYSRTKED